MVVMMDQIDWLKLHVVNVVAGVIVGGFDEYY